MPKIFVLTGPDVGHSFEVAAGALFGRADDCSVRLKDASVSRHHARLEHTEAGWSVVDLDSRNGVFSEGERVERVTLEEGREFTLGEVVCKFRDAAPAKSEVDFAARKQPVSIPRRDPTPAPEAVDDDIVLEGEWDDAKAAAHAPAAVTSFTERPNPNVTASSSSSFGTQRSSPSEPSLARRQATEKLAAAGVLPSSPNAGARGVLQYGKIESRPGFMQSDFDQQPLWIKFLILAAVLVVVAGVSWIAFRAVILVRGSPSDPPALEESSDEAK